MVRSGGVMVTVCGFCFVIVKILAAIQGLPGQVLYTFCRVRWQGDPLSIFLPWLPFPAE